MLESYLDELAQAGQEIHTLPGVILVRVPAADGKKPDLTTLADRHHRSRRDAVGVAAEQQFLLLVPERATARPCRTQKRRKGFQRLVVARDDLDEAGARNLRRGLILKNQQHGSLGAKVLTQRGFERLQTPFDVVNAEKSHGQLVDVVYEAIVCLGNVNQLGQLPLELVVSLPKHGNLSLDQGDRRTA